MNKACGLAFLEGVTKKYGAVLALDRASFEIRESEIFGFIGPNGAGKTTTIKILVGLISDFSGSLSVAGFRMPQERHELFRMIGYMPQDIAFQEWRTVDHALLTFGRLSGLDKGRLSRRIPEVLEQVGLTDSRGRKIIHLSGGMVQRLGIAQALLHQPRLLVLDEPLSGLDPGNRIQVKSLLRELSRAGMTIFFSSHILSDVQDVADRIGILSRGRVLKIGTLDELKSHFSTCDDVELVLSHDEGNWRGAGDLEGIRSVTGAETGRFFLHLEPGADVDAAIHAAVERLLEKGNRIRSIRPVAPSLDEVYLKFVGEGEGR
jgi:ABC-2 type transport system ATP-binding protein